jgi:hypothetical protein
MEFKKRPFGWWCNLVAKSLLSCLAVVALITLLDMMKLWYHVHPVARRVSDESKASDDISNYHPGNVQNGDIFWPQYLGSGHSSVHRAIINGVQIIDQAWNTTSSGRDAIDFYRHQMTARGWQDVTEETLDFHPELRPDEHYLGLYQQAKDSDLILKRGGWSMQVTTFPNKQEDGQNTISVCAASTPSLREFLSQMGPASEEDTTKRGMPLDVVQESGKDIYHISLTARNEPAAQAFQETLAELGAKGWSPAMAMPGEKAPSGYFAWLVRGNQYAGLSVAASPQGGGSAVTFTEVTPK